MSLCFVYCGNPGGCCGKAAGFGFDFQLPHVLLCFACFATVLPHIWNEQNEEARAKHTKSRAKLKNYHLRKVKQQNRSLQRGGRPEGAAPILLCLLPSSGLFFNLAWLFVCFALASSFCSFQICGKTVAKQTKLSKTWGNWKSKPKPPAFPQQPPRFPQRTKQRDI